MASSRLVRAFAYASVLAVRTDAVADHDARQAIYTMAERLGKERIYLEYRLEVAHSKPGVIPTFRWAEMKFGMQGDRDLYGNHTAPHRQPQGGDLVIIQEGSWANGVGKSHFSQTGYVGNKDWGTYYSDTYLFHLGFPIRQPEKQQARSDPRVLDWIPQCFSKTKYLARGESTIDGVACQLLEAEGQDKIWIDVAHGGVPRKRELYYRPGRLRVRYTNSDLKEVLPGFWLPQRCLREDFAEREAEQKPFLTTETHVKVMEAGDKVGANRFTFEFPIGTAVRDDVAKKTYLVSAGGNRYFEKSIAELEKSAKGWTMPEAAWWVIAINALVISAMLVLAWKRRYHSS